MKENSYKRHFAETETCNIIFLMLTNIILTRFQHKNIIAFFEIQTYFFVNEGVAFPCETPTKEPIGISSDYQFSPPKASN